MTTFEADDREQLGSAARGLLDRRSATSQVRSIIDGDRQFDRLLWKEMCDLGWAGLLIPQEYGGAEAGMAAAIVVLQALGAHVTPSPYLSSAVLAPAALRSGAKEPAKIWLPKLSSGDALGAVALTGPSGRLQPGLFSVAAVRSGGHYRLTGRAHFVLDGEADVLLVGARTDTGSIIATVTADASGLTKEAVPSIDRTRELWHIDFDGVEVADDQVLARGDEADHIIDHLTDVAGLALAADAIGSASVALTMSVEYAKQRMQFGRLIGSFQAIKHKLADMYVLVEAGKATVTGAADSFDSEAADALRLASSTGTFVRQSASRVVGDAMQAHGGIGFTWEHDCHLLLKRAKFDEFYLTDLWSQRDRLVSRLDSKEPAA